jgi:hypothetical protein
MSYSIIQYCIFHPGTKQVLEKTSFHGYGMDNKSIHKYAFTDDLTRTHLMNRPQAQERLQTMREKAYVIQGGLEIAMNDLEIKKIEISYLLLE